MESMRDIVIIIFGLNGIVASVVLVVIGFKLYGRTCEALERVGRASDHIHNVTEGVRSGARAAKETLAVAGSAVPGLTWFRMTHRTAATIARAAKIISRFKRPPA